MTPITVIKLNEIGQETWRYQGNLLERGEHHLTLEATYDRDDRDFHGMPLCRGDRFVETYYTDKWYNIYEIHAREDDHLRGWYCNIGQPVQVDGAVLSYVDLALDLLVFPDGRQVVLDEDEFDRLRIDPQTRSRAEEALNELQAAFRNHNLQQKSDQ